MNIRAAILGTGYERVLRPLLFSSHQGDPEAIHEQMIEVLGQLSAAAPVFGLLRTVAAGSSTPVSIAGIRFPGRVGVAAGLDKDGLAARIWGALGFGFAELGTVTALPQPGNPKPRVFRLRDSQALLNRMGFNNRGASAMAQLLASYGVKRAYRTYGIPLGISIGKSKTVSLDAAVDDYTTSLRFLAPYADYIAINVSSPNTPGLRSLQLGQALRPLVQTLTREATVLVTDSYLPPVPIFVKVSPDLTWEDLDQVLQICTEEGAAGIIATNTTLARNGLAPADTFAAAEEGGLSGAPLTRRALDVVRYICQHIDLPVMGVGGIMTAADAEAMFAAGASLVQLYTGFIYHGPALVEQINDLDRRRI